MWRRILLIILAIFAVFVLLGFVLSLLNTNESRVYLESAPVIQFPGDSVRFSLSGASALAPAENEEVDDVRILESVPSTMEAGVRVVLARVPDVAGVVLGTVSGSTFAPLLADGTEKYALSMMDDGRAIFGTGMAVPQFRLPQDVPEGESVEEEFGSTTASSKTVDIPVPGGEERIMSFSVPERTGKDLGAGVSPRLMSGTSAVIALSSEGAVRIDPATGARTVLLPYRGMDLFLSGISADGRTLVLKSSADAFFDVFTLAAPDAKRLGIIAPGDVASGIAFIDAEHFLIRLGETLAVLYEVPKQEAPAGRIVGSPLTIR